MNDGLVTSTEDLVKEYRRVSVRMLEDKLGISRGTIQNILKRVGINCVRTVGAEVTSTCRL